MSIPTMAAARAALSPYHAAIRSIVEDAWDEWRAVQSFREDSGFGPTLYTRTISNYMFDAIARRAIPRLGALDKVMIVVDAQTFKAHINGMLLRMKKGGEDNLGCNHPTLLALAFEEADAHFPGFPPKTAKVELIWLPNDIWTQIDQVLVVARDGDELVWQYEIPRGEGASITVRPTPSAPDGGSGGDLIKPKVATVQKPSKKS
jgi:hypothetical protein